MVLILLYFGGGGLCLFFRFAKWVDFGRFRYASPANLRPGRFGSLSRIA
ncbi:MAG: hypothetical protein JKY95_14015 [Planctomycetaceae bacterium]|nr:hypothetical protein [Planctomycetaceae bacterium]